MKHLQLILNTDLNNQINFRNGESKIGEHIQLNWKAPEVTFVLLGIEEDIGVRVNNGIGGTHTAWKSFFKAFINVQSNDKFLGNEIGLFGYFSFDDLCENISSDNVSIIDDEVEIAINMIADAGKIPIIIGGGHNNAYPIIKGLSMIKKQLINSINLDAHTDFRMKEGRHSGNGFRYAFEEAYLGKYAIIGLHENYNAQSIVNEISKLEAIQFTFWEDIFLRETISFKEAILQAIRFTNDKLTGIELDLDSVENVLSSAFTPNGVSTTQARQYMHYTSQISNVAYLHICEGAAKLNSGQTDIAIGKLISYLVSDFIKGYLSIQRGA